MTTSNLQVWFYVELTLKAKADGTSKTVYLSNRAIIDDTNKGRYIPILKNIQGIGTVAGKYLPQDQRGAVTIDNSPGSYGYQRRFSDLFERYTLVNQTIKLYAAVTSITDLDVSSDFTLQWQGTVSRHSRQGGEIQLEIASDAVSRRVITKAVTSSAFPSAPTKSLGKHLPIVFGTGVYCEAIRTAADGDASPEYAYATTLSTVFPVGGVTAYYSKDKDGQYRAISSAGGTGTLLYGNSAVSGQSHAIWTSDTDLTRPGRARKFTVSTAYAITSASLRIYKDAGTDTNGTLICRIMQDDFAQAFTPTNAPGTVLGQSAYDTSTLAAGAGEYDLSFGFATPIVLVPGKDYYIAFIYGNNAVSGLVNYYYHSSATETEYLFYPTHWNATAGSQKWFWGVYGAVFTDTKSSAGDSDGLGYAYFEVTQSGTPTVQSDLTKLDLIVAVSGLKDDGSGTITGVANTQITSPAYALRLLDKEWNGSTWTGGKLDWTRLSNSRGYVTQAGTAYDRSIAGKTEGQTFLADFYEQLCRQFAMRLYMYNGGATPLALYAYGLHQTTAAVISDDDAVIERVDQLGVETVINRVLMYYDKRVLNADPTSAAAQDGFQNYAGVIDWLYSTNTYTTLVSTLSETLYGRRELVEREYPLIGDSTTATEMAKYLINIFREPQTYVTFRVPFFKYNARDLFDVVELLHPDMPSHFGTTADARPPTYGGADVDPLQGHHWKRAKRYRVQLESKEALWDGGSYPQLRFMGRIIPNTGIDPT